MKMKSDVFKKLMIYQSQIFNELEKIQQTSFTVKVAMYIVNLMYNCRSVIKMYD